jgi:hypothetical protein
MVSAVTWLKVESFHVLRRVLSPFAKAQSFPTPMEEPKKVLRAQYLGMTEVLQAVGMNVINDAIEKVSNEAAPECWGSVNVSISPSVIAIRPTGVSRSKEEEEKERYWFFNKTKSLSFLGRWPNNSRGSCALLEFLGHRQERQELRVHRAHGSGQIHCARVSLRAEQRRPVQDHRGSLQSEWPSLLQYSIQY